MSNKELNFKIQAIRIKQREGQNQAIYIAVVTARDFLSRASERFIVDYYSRNNGKEDGYQRQLSDGAVNKIIDYVLKETKNPLLPTAVLVNSRTPIEFKGNGSIGELFIDQPLYVIDGQHRFEAWKKMMNDIKLEEEYGDYQFPVVILSNFNVYEEVQQFFVINNRQRKIKTDLAQRNLLTLAKSSETKKFVPDNSMWILHATKIVDILNEKISNSVWNDKIILPSDSAEIKKTKVITQQSFVSSLKPFFVGQSAIFTYDDPDLPIGGLLDKWAGLIDDLWKVVSNVYPETIDNFHDYSLMKTVGVFSLHLLFLEMIRQEDAKNIIINDKAVREKILSKFETYLKNARSKNMKLDFWRVKVPKSIKDRGEFAGAYSSSVGHKQLVSKIILGY